MYRESNMTLNDAPERLNKIKALIFDYNGVVTTRGTFSSLVQEYCLRLGKEPHILDEIVTRRWKEARIGKIDEKLLWSDIANYLGYDKTKLREEWITQFPVRRDLLKKIKDYKKSYKVGLLTNEVRDWMESSIKTNNLKDYFDVIVTSYEEGVAKPDPKIFQIMVEKLGFLPQECVYVDDQLKNTVAASKLGFNSILFSSVEQMEKEMKKYV